MTGNANGRRKVCVVDAFASEPFRGNPAAVCVMASPAAEAWMQAVAGELNLSETAFVVAREDGDWDLRWFTPVAEVALCGHATLASAHALWEEGHLGPDRPARFHTRSGLLSCRRSGDGIAMDFPSMPAVAGPVPDGLSTALGADVRAFGRSSHDWLVEVPHAAIVRSMEPDLAALARLPVRGLIVTAGSDVAGFDFVSRFFAPAVGVGVDGDRVELTGTAVTAWRGELLGVAAG